MVTCSVPSSRRTVPAFDSDTPSRKIRELGRTSTGGHFTAQAPLQSDFDGCAVSLSKRYSVKPAPSWTTGLSAPEAPTLSCTQLPAARLAAVAPVPGDSLLSCAVPAT